MKPFFLALQFLTVIPIHIKTRIEDEDFGKSLLYFPLIGLILGSILAVSLYVFRGFSSLVLAALIILVSTLLTGGLHLDGFADTCDGLYGFHSSEKRLAIMRDSRLGVMGAVGLICLLLLKFSLLSQIPFAILGKVLIMTAVFSRWSQVVACYGSRYPREKGKAKLFIEQVRCRYIIAGGLFVFFLFLLLAKGKGAIIFLGAIIVVFLFIRYFRRKIGGMTGDTIGAVSEISEVSILLLSALVLI